MQSTRIGVYSATAMNVRKNASDMGTCGRRITVLWRELEAYMAGDRVTYIDDCAEDAFENAEDDDGEIEGEEICASGVWI